MRPVLPTLLALLPTALACAAGCNCPPTSECDDPLPDDTVFLAVVTGNGESTFQQLWADLKTLIGGNGQRTVQLDVLETFRGQHLAVRSVLTDWGDCGTLLDTGRRYLVYTRRDEQSGLDQTSTCQGTRLVGSQPDPRLEFLRASRRNPVLTSISGTVAWTTGPAPKAPFPFDPTRVEVRLTTGDRHITVVPDRSGHFQFPILPGGHFTLFADTGGFLFGDNPRIVDLPTGCSIQRLNPKPIPVPSPMPLNTPTPAFGPNTPPPATKYWRLDPTGKSICSISPDLCGPPHRETPTPTKKKP